MLKLIKISILSLALVTTLASTPVPTQVDYSLKFAYSEYNCMKVALWHEARGESIRGIHAVASVIINRTKHKDYPSTICEVIKQPRQFQRIDLAFKRGITAYNASERQALARVQQVAFEAVYTGFKPSVEALSYHVVGHGVYWSKYLSKRVKIDRHIFGSVV